MKNCKHSCTRLEDKSLSAWAPFIVCQKTAALSMHSMHPLNNIVTAAVIRDVMKKQYIYQIGIFFVNNHKKNKHSNHVDRRRTIFEVVR